MSKLRYSPVDLPDEIAAEIEATRKRMPASPPEPEPLIDETRLRSILRNIGVAPREGQFETFRKHLDHILAQFNIDTANALRKVTPSELAADLEKIEEAASDLADLFEELRYAEDAMVRIVRPELYETGEILFGPPEFVVRMLDIAEIARAAKIRAGEPKPYVNARRGKLAENHMIAELLLTWNEYFEDKATFTGSVSPAVRFVLECLNFVGAHTQSHDALAKRCQRIARKMSNRSR